MTTAPTTEFHVRSYARAPGRILPQRVGRVLWLPMLVMASMAFAVGFIVALVRANAIVNGGAASTVAALNHVVPGFMFLGFATVFGAISFAIARILGEFRVGGGWLQEAAGAEVQALRMPGTAKLFVAGMMMAMMTLVAAVVLHFVAAGAIAGGSTDALSSAETWAIQLEGVRRLGVAVYLLSVALGLATIVRVLRFQALRLHEIAV